MDERIPFLDLVLRRERAVRFQDKRDSFLQVCPDLLQCRALGVRAGQLFDEPDVPLGNTPENSRQFEFHQWASNLIVLG